MHYLNIKKLYSNNLIQILVFISIVVFGTFFIASHSSQQAYAATLTTPITNVAPPETFTFSWVNTNQISLTVKPEIGSPITVDFNYVPASNSTNPLAQQIPASYDLQSCTGDCVTYIYDQFTNYIIGSTTHATGLSLSDCSTGATSCKTLTLTVAGIIPVQTFTANINNSDPIIVDVNQPWNDGNGVAVKTPSSYGRSNLEFLSPTEIYDITTHVEYTTDSGSGSNNLYCGVNNSNGNCERYLGNGYAIYWPTENRATSTTINPDVAIPQVLVTTPGQPTANCAGGILVQTNSGANLYADVVLLPATFSSGQCYFNEPSYDALGINTSTLETVAGSGQFYSSSSPIQTLPTAAIDIKQNLINMNMEYAMFQWTSSGISTLAGEIPLENLKSANLSDYNQIMSKCTQCTAGYQIYTTTTCTNLTTFPFLLINYKNDQTITDLNIANQNTIGYVYYPSTSGSGFTNGWPTSTSVLNCLFGTPPYVVPTNNTIEFSPSGTYTATSAVTYIAYPSYSACASTSTASICSQTPPPGGGPVPSGSPGANVDACYYQEEGWTYLCGQGALPSSTLASPKTGNQFSIYPVVGLSAPTSGNAFVLANQQSDNEFDFTTGDCYQVQTLPSANYPNFDPATKQYANEQAWVQQPAKDCSSDEFLNPTNAQQPYQPLPNLDDGNLTAPGGAELSVKKCVSDCIVNDYLNPFIKFLNVAVGLVVVISVASGGIQYSTSRDNPDAVKAARKRITNALIGLVCYFLLAGFLNFIIPGGI